jgi:hypothetical protein
MLPDMKKSWSILIVALLCWSAFSVHAETPAPTYPNSKAPGAAIAQQVSLLTGIAISPLFGSSAYGCYKWYHATAEQRPGLPWFAQVWFWLPGLLIVAVCFIKDTAGNALPTAVKKPFDIIEAFENKISGLVATGAIVPFLMMMTKDSGDPQAMLGSLGMAAMDFSWLYNIIIIPIAMLAFFFVFLASNAINVLIILSPFTTVDAALKGVRLVLLGTVAATALANPWVGLAWALFLIIVSYFMAGWSFRLSHFGLVYLWDFFTIRRNRFKPGVRNRMFLGRRINKVPARTYGTVFRDDRGQLVLKYRPWLILQPRLMTLPAGQYAVGKGLVNSEIMRLEGEKAKTVLLLPPRYRSHEADLVAAYGLVDVRPVGLSAAVKWLREFFVGKDPQPAAV